MNDNPYGLSDLNSTALTLLNAEADAITLVDPGGTVLFLNDAAVQYFGKPAAEMVGRCLWDIYPAEIKNHHKILIHQAAQTAHTITTKYKDKDRWRQTLFCPIQGKDNRVANVAIYSRDITAQVNAEERLKLVFLELITAQEDERHRISQDLHDDVGQKMTALIFELRAIKDTVEKDQKVSLKEINAVIQNMESIIKHVRQIFYQLYPPSLTRMSISKVLAGFCSTFEDMNRVHVDFSCQEEIPELPGNYVAAIYRFVQEGLTNVAKHAKASAVWINLEYIDGDLNISLEDNGMGFESKQMSEGIGLHGIRERFFVLGGDIEIESAPGKGTRLSGTIPFKTSDV